MNARLWCLLSLLVAASAAQATVVYVSPTCGTGSNNIPDAGTLTCSITIADPGVVNSGNAVTFKLIGFGHEYSGDVSVTLTHVGYSGPEYVFSQIGKISNDPFAADPVDFFGYSAQFGDPLGATDNYEFNSGYLASLWSMGAALGSADFIPGEAQHLSNGALPFQYFTTDPLSGARNSFSSSFAGQPLAGVWLMTITDHADGPSSPAVAGSLLQFQLTFDTVASTAVPEPGMGLGIGFVLLGLVCGGPTRGSAAGRGARPTTEWRGRGWW